MNKLDVLGIKPEKQKRILGTMEYGLRVLLSHREAEISLSTGKATSFDLMSGKISLNSLLLKINTK